MSAASAPDRWLVLEIPKPRDPNIAALLVDELLVLSERGVEEHEEALLVYFALPEEEVEATIRDVTARIRSLGGPDAGRLTHRWQAHEDWEEVWRVGLEPRRVTPRIVVSPTWMSPSLEPGDVLVTLDPGMAFGTAEHPTTRGCLRLLDPRIEPGDRIADIGAGSGILSIAAALLGADHVTAVEMDHWSCVVARENAEANGVADRIDVIEGAVGREFLPDVPPLDGVLANIEQGVLGPLLPGMRPAIRDGGWLILSGILDHEADDILREAREAGFRLVEEDREGTWWTGAFIAGAEGPTTER